MDQPLAINDIITPSAIGFWPLAWGWWLILFLILIIIVISVYFWRKYQFFWAYRRLAIQELKSSYSRFKNDNQKEKCLCELMTTLKRLRLSQNIKNKNVALKPSLFLTELNRSSVEAPYFSDDTLHQIESALYQKAQHFDLERFYKECLQWAKQYPTKDKHNV